MKARQIVEAITNYTDVRIQLERTTCDIYISGTPETEVTGVVHHVHGHCRCDPGSARSRREYDHHP